MTTLLVIKSSLFTSAGQSSGLADDYAQAWLEQHPDGRLIVRDLGSEPVPHLDHVAFSGFTTDSGERSAEQQSAVTRSDLLVDEVKSADELVIALPMYNFSVPSTFKAWMDHVARAGLTFQYTENGPQGLLKDRRVVVIATRGGQYAGTEADSQTPLIRSFFGLLGLERLAFVYAEGLAMGPEAAEEATIRARKQLQSLAAGDATRVAA